MSENYSFSPQASQDYVETLLEDLEQYPVQKVAMVFEAWRKTSKSRITTADAINLIERGGRPPLKESDIIAIRKKHGEDRTSDDWSDLREWEAQQRTGWGDNVAKPSINLQQDNQKLRSQITQLEAQLARRNTDDVINKQSDFCFKSIREKLEKSLSAKIQSTVDFMRKSGASENDVLEFLDSVQC